MYYLHCMRYFLAFMYRRIIVNTVVNIPYSLEYTPPVLKQVSLFQCMFSNFYGNVVCIVIGIGLGLNHICETN